jgi:tungstate transport system permease protein
MALLWQQISDAVSLIAHGNAFLFSLVWVTLRVMLVSTAAALLIGLPLGLCLGLGRFRGRGALQLLANASLGLPPVVVGVVVLLLLLPQGPLGSLRILFTVRALYIVQAILALPYVVALTAAALQGLPAGLLAQARALGAGWAARAWLALREARVGVLAAIIAAAGSTIAEAGAVIIVGGNLEGHDATLAGSLVGGFTNNPNDPYETATALLLLILILILGGGLTLVQRRAGLPRWRFREART